MVEITEVTEVTETDNVLPLVKIKSIRFQNFKVFDDYTFDFSSENGIKEFVCFIGPNGCGKSTVLNSIQMLFNRYEGRDIEKLKINLGKAVRHVGEHFSEIYVDDDFLITAKMDSSFGEYEVQFNKSGFVQDHPQGIKENVFRLCYAARFDQELHKFQLAREKWDKFKELFEAVTSFTIEENQDVIKYFSGTDDPTMKQLINDYVLSFSIKKPHEVISYKECSDGEKKIIKSFSTLLTLEYSPSIILVDNIEMHVEKGRHIKLIQAMKDCFPNSQIFSTTHSYYVSKVFGKQSGVFDLRMIKSSEGIKKQPWRLCIIDEINDCLVKLLLAPNSEELVCRGKKIISTCEGDINDLQKFQEEVGIFLKEVSDIFIKCIMR
jgi:ABC-type lipoprotein export system ATPase subunit